MKVYIDDSGDAGLKLLHGSSRWIVMTACIFLTDAMISQTMADIGKARVLNSVNGRVYRFDREFKFNKTSDPVKLHFFRSVSRSPFFARSILFDKRNAGNLHLLERPNDLKSFLIQQLLIHSNQTIQHARLYIDGQDTHAFNLTYQSDKQYFLQTVNKKNPGTLRDVSYVDSKKEPLIQLADMMSGLMRSRQSSLNEERNDELFLLVAQHFEYPGDIWFFVEKQTRD